MTNEEAKELKTGDRIRIIESMGDLEKHGFDGKLYDIGRIYIVQWNTSIWGNDFITTTDIKPHYMDKRYYKEAYFSLLLPTDCIEKVVDHK